MPPQLSKPSVLQDRRFFFFSSSPNLLVPLKKPLFIFLWSFREQTFDPEPGETVKLTAIRLLLKEIATDSTSDISSQIKTVQSIAQYKPFITSALQRFSVTCGSILHLKINILIYIYRLISVFPCTVFLNRHRQRYDWYEKNPFFRIRKSGLLPPELLGLTRQSPLFRTQKSLVSRLTLILHDHPHLQLSL